MIVLSLVVVRRTVSIVSPAKIWVSSVVVSLARMERKLAVTGSPCLLACLLRVRACYFCVGRQLFTAVDLEWQILDRGRRSLPNPGGCSNTPTTPRVDYDSDADNSHCLGRYAIQ